VTRRWPVAGVLFGVLWVFVRGPAFTASALLGQFLFGVAIGLPVAFVFRRLYAETVDLRRIVSTLPAVGGYLFVFAREVVVANVDVARRVLVPGMPIEPEVILVPLRVETDLGVTTIANSITVTPGTIALDHDPEENALYVHSIDGSDLESVVDPIRTWERYALVIFDEEHSPDDPAPPVRNTPKDVPPKPLRAPMAPGGLWGERSTMAVDEVTAESEAVDDEVTVESEAVDDEVTAESEAVDDEVTAEGDEGGADDGR
jgi:multicomponent Na+:H+ antiporter subunit E